MSAKSIFQKLDGRNAILHVSRNELDILRPESTRCAIGTRDMNESSCIVLMGMSPRSAIVMARSSGFVLEGYVSGTPSQSAGNRGNATIGGLHSTYMGMLRRVVSAFLKEPELFQMPLAWCMFSQTQDDTVLKQLHDSTLRAFGHLHVEARASLYPGSHLSSELWRSGRHSLLVVRDRDEAPEIYIEDHLVCPDDYSGSLALVLDKLGLQQVGQADEYDDARLDGNDQEI